MIASTIMLPSTYIHLLPTFLCHLTSTSCRLQLRMSASTTYGDLGPRTPPSMSAESRNKHVSTPPSMSAESRNKHVSTPPKKPLSCAADAKSDISVTSTPHKSTQRLEFDALMAQRSHRLSKELRTNFVDAKPRDGDGRDIFDTLYDELLSELPIIGSVQWDDIAEKLRAPPPGGADGVWSAWVREPSQTNLKKVLQTLCHIIYGAVGSNLGDRSPKIIHFNSNTIAPPSIFGNTAKYPPKPDFVSMEESRLNSQGWRHYETLWEHKTSGGDEGSDDLICKLIVRAVQALRDCPFRRFVIVVVVQRTKYRLILVDSSGGCRFPQADIIADTAKFIRFVATLLLVSRHRLGYDNAVDIPVEGAHFVLRFGEYQLLVKENPISYPTRDHLVGRGTNIYLAKYDKVPGSGAPGSGVPESGVPESGVPESGWSLVVKDCWQYQSREKEEDRLEELKDV